MSVLDNETNQLFQLLNIDLFVEEDRLKYNDGAVVEVVRSVPEAAESKYTFTAYYDQDLYPLTMAVALRGSLEAVQLIYEAFPKAIKHKDSHSWTPLFYACKFKAPFEVVRFLADKHPSAIESTSSCGWTPLHMACYCGAPVDVVRMLAERYPAAFEAKDMSGRTLPEFAKRFNESPEVILLLTTLHRLFCTDPGDDQLLAMLLKWNGGMWSSQVAPILHWRTSLLTRVDVPPSLMPTLLRSVGREGKVQTMFQIVRNTMTLFHDTGRTPLRLDGPLPDKYLTALCKKGGAPFLTSRAA